MSARQVSLSSTGLFQPLPPGKVLEGRVAAADKPGEHLWVVGALWRIADPERLGETYLDAENLLQFSAPGCFKCEKQYSRKLARQRCTGSTG